MKICRQCKLEKPLSAFYKNKNNPSGYVSICKICYKTAYIKEDSPDNQRQGFCKNGHDMSETRIVYASGVSCCKLCKKFYVKNKAKTSIEKTKRTWIHIKYKHNLTKDQANHILIAQDYKCAICHSEISFGYRKFAIDHCHKTGKVRGILCITCNLGLGSFKDNTESLQNAISYLKRDAVSI